MHSQNTSTLTRLVWAGLFTYKAILTGFTHTKKVKEQSSCGNGLAGPVLIT